MSQIQRELPDEQVKGDGEALPPAMPDEQQEIAIQLDNIRRWTVWPGLIRCPVSKVTSAPNSEQIVVVVDHPVDGEESFFFPKPPYWSTKFELPSLLNAYGLNTTNWYALQTERVYMAYDGADWRLVGPPADWKRTAHRWKNALRNVLSGRVGTLMDIVSAPFWTVRRRVPKVGSVGLAAWTGLATGSMFAAGLTFLPEIPLIGFTTPLLLFTAFFVSFLTGLVVFQPPGDD